MAPLVTAVFWHYICAFNNRFSVFPNPVGNVLHVKVNRSITGKATFRLTDMAGKLLLQKAVVVDGNDVEFSNLNLTPGSYVLKIVFNGEQYIQKVTVQ